MSGGVLFLRGGGGTSLGLGGGGDGGHGGHGGPIGPPDPITNGIAFQYTLTESVVTSAGVYLNSTGFKIRDLWGGVRKAAGTYSDSWDGKDDFGNTVIIDATDYDIRVQRHNVGTQFYSLFNTAAAPCGIGSVATFGEHAGMAVCGTNWVKFLNYTEGSVHFMKAAMASANTFTKLNATPLTSFRPFVVCGDATTLYVGGGFPLGGDPHLQGVIKYTVSTGAAATFSSLTSDGLNINTDWASATATTNFSKALIPQGVNTNSADHTHDITGIAVQQSGNYLAWTVKESDIIKIVHKTTGAVIATLSGTVTDPTAICWGPDESTLWVASGTNIKVLTPSGGDWTDTIGITNIATGQTVCALATSSASYNRVAAALGSHQIKLYNATTFANSATVGASGGYASTSVWAANRFDFYGPTQTSDGTIHGAMLAFDANDDLIVFQRAMQTYLRFTDPDTTPTDHDGSAVANLFLIPYQSGAETASAGGTRFIVNRYLELTVDYSQTPVPGWGNGNFWTPTHYYGYAYKTETFVSSQKCGLSRLWSSGGVLFATHYKPNEDVYRVKLTSSGITELTSLGNKESFIGYDSSGNYYQWLQGGTSITKGTMTGLDGSSNPVYTTAKFADIPADDGHGLDWGGDASQFFPLLSNSTVACMQPDLTGTASTDSTIYHAGLLKSTGWLARQALCQDADQKPIPRDGRISALSANAGSSTAGQKDLWALSAQGEGFESGQAGAHNIYDIYGLYLMTLGHETPTTLAGASYKEMAIGDNGNAQSIAMIYETTNNTYWYLFTDENHSMMQAFKFDNIASLAYLTGTGQKGETISLSADSAAGGGPSVIGSAGYTSNWANLTGWTQVGSSLSVSGGELIQGSGAFNAWASSHIYRNPYTGATASNVCLKLTIPAASLFSYTRDNGSEHRSQFGVFARLNTGTGARIGVMVNYIRQGDGDSSTENGNGYFTGSFYAYDGSVLYDLGTKIGSKLEGSPGSSYSLLFAITGTQPTRLYYKLLDVTTNEVVLEDYTENWSTAYESAGKVGCHLGMENVRASQFDEFALTWSSVLPPI